ncbi:MULTISPECIES: GntR family transcriptional regulator [unclassified Mycolicibacterium]|uniref:GntR family transcriptional regulator n=1 Tax=unclassified Mycolicibacterium TaxID=2636767 RepID=UPI002ED98491
MPITSPAARSTRGFVLESLRERILGGELAAGQQLRQENLGADYAVSAATVREALRQLESDGLVVHYPNRGVFVVEITASEMTGVLLPLRLHLERYAFDESARHGRDRLFTVLDECVERMRRAAAQDDLRGVTEADVAFHRAIIDAAGSVQTLQLWDSIQWRLRVQFQRLGDPQRRLEGIVEEHVELLAVLRSTDTAAAHQALEEHIVGSAQALLDDRIGAESI